MSCLLSKLCSIKTSTVQLRKLSVPSNNYFARRTFNRPLRNQKSSSYTYPLLKPTIFCVSVTSGSIVLATIVQYEKLCNNAKKLTNFQDFFKSKSGKNTGIFSDLKKQWNKFEPSEKIFGTILLLNCLVFLAWQVPRYQHVMVRYFTTDALAKKIPVSSLLLSAFSHSSAVHLAFNMYALHTFCPVLIQPWGEMSSEEFTALYISSSVVSALASIYFRRIYNIPGISLGASGALLSVIGYFALSHPYEKLGVIFLPYIQFDAIYGLYGIISIDTLGLLLGWKIFDHAAHLGGTLFGMFWYKFISTQICDNRNYIVRNWIRVKKLVLEHIQK